MAKTSKKSKKPKAGKVGKTPSKKHKKKKASGKVLSPKPRNLIFLTDDGKVVVATSTGHVQIVTNDALAKKLQGSLVQRQQAALDLTAVLRAAGFPVVAGSTTVEGP